MSNILEIRNTTVKYGEALAIQDVSIEVPKGKIVTLIGANGAGKSTTLNAMIGFVPIVEGEILFKDEDISRLRTPERIKKGLTLVPEGRALFPHMSVYKNLILGASLRRDKQGIADDLEFVYTLFPKLKERSKQKAGTLSGGEQQMVAIGRGILSKPELLCLDEPSLGLAPIVIEEVGKRIKEINEINGTSILLVEQNVHLAFGIADYCYTLQVGRVKAHGEINEMKENDAVRQAYFGG